MVRRRTPLSQTWRTFLDDHLGSLGSLVAVDSFTVPTAMFTVLFVCVALAHDRRGVSHCNRDPVPRMG